MEIRGETAEIRLRIRKSKITSHMNTQQISFHSSHELIPTRVRTSCTHNDHTQIDMNWENVRIV